MRTPDRLRRYVDYKKAETAFRLWDPDANRRILRKEITRGLKCAAALTPPCCLFCCLAIKAFLTRAQVCL